MDLISLATQRLTLRDISEADFDAIHAYARDPEVSRFMSWGPNTEADTRGFIQNAIEQQICRPRDAWTLAICLKDMRLIGGCGLHVTDAAARQGFIGYVLHREYWGKGYATECARALLSMGFTQLGLHRIWTDCDTENRASEHVLQKIGMRREATLRENKLRDGTWRSSHVYAVLARELSCTPER